MNTATYHASPVAAASRREGLARAEQSATRRQIGEFLKVQHERGECLCYTARFFEKALGCSLNDARSRLSEGVRDGDFEESPLRIKEDEHIACTGYRWRAKAVQLTLDFGAQA